MRKDDRLDIIGFHIKEANRCYDEIKAIKKNPQSSNGLKDHGDIQRLDSSLGLHVDLANCARIGAWLNYTKLVNAYNLTANEIPDTLRYYSVIKNLITILRYKPNKRRTKS